MLIAHLVPGYFAAVCSRPGWKTGWNKGQRVLLWIAALGSTALPDIDIIYNALLRGFINHSTLWTHSLIPHSVIGLGWLILRYVKRWPFLQMLAGLTAVGGLRIGVDLKPYYCEADARVFLADALWGAGRKAEAAAEWMTVSKMAPSYPGYEQPINEAKRRLAERPPT
jgi:hypothetical protein